MSQGKSQTRYSGWKKVPSEQCLSTPTPWTHWQKEGSQEPSGNRPSSLQVWTTQFSCSVVVVESEGELVAVDIELLLSFGREAERMIGTRAKRSSFMVGNLAFLDLENLLATVALACVAPLFYISPPGLIKEAYFT